MYFLLFSMKKLLFFLLEKYVFPFIFLLFFCKICISFYIPFIFCKICISFYIPFIFDKRVTKYVFPFIFLLLKVEVSEANVDLSYVEIVCYAYTRMVFSVIFSKICTVCYGKSTKILITKVSWNFLSTYIKAYLGPKLTFMPIYLGTAWLLVQKYLILDFKIIKKMGVPVFSCKKMQSKINICISFKVPGIVATM